MISMANFGDEDFVPVLSGTLLDSRGLLCQNVPVQTFDLPQAVSGALLIKFTPLSHHEHASGPGLEFISWGDKAEETFTCFYN